MYMRKKYMPLHRDTVKQFTINEQMSLRLLHYNTECSEITVCMCVCTHAHTDTQCGAKLQAQMYSSKQKQ